MKRYFFLSLVCGVAIANQPKTVDIAIIGGGPAGWSAALYGARLGNNTLLLTGNLPGGQLTKTGEVENWPGISRSAGMSIMDNLADQAMSYGAQQLLESVKDLDLTKRPFTLKTDEGTVISARSVIIATGSNPKMLGVPGENELLGDGISTCAICDAPLYKNRSVVVVGGGDAAVEEALQLAVYAKDVTILVRAPKFRASYAMQQRLSHAKNISVRFNTEIKDIVSKTVSDPEKKRTKKMLDLEVVDSIKRGTPSTIQVDGLFIAIGLIPNTALVRGKVKIDKHGYIMVSGRTQKTSIPGVFAAGDVADSDYHQAGVASGHGIAAAIDADRFLRHE